MTTGVNPDTYNPHRWSNLILVQYIPAMGTTLYWMPWRFDTNLASGIWAGMAIAVTDGSFEPTDLHGPSTRDSIYWCQPCPRPKIWPLFIPYWTRRGPAAGGQICDICLSVTRSKFLIIFRKFQNLFLLVNSACQKATVQYFFCCRAGCTISILLYVR